MTKTDLKAIIKESLQELLFDSKVIETLMVEVISKVSSIREVSAMGAGVGSIEVAPVKDEFDLDTIEDEEKDAEAQLAENIASFWGKALDGDPAFKVKVEARGKTYTPTEKATGMAKDDPARANLRKASQITVGGAPIFDKSNFTKLDESTESNVDLGANSFLSQLLKSDKVRASMEQYLPELQDEGVAK